MNITKEGDLMNKFNAVWKDKPEWVEAYNKWKPDEKESFKTVQTVISSNLAMSKLLEECLYFINQVPNKKYKPKSYKDSYELASKISDYLNTLK